MGITILSTSTGRVPTVRQYAALKVVGRESWRDDRLGDQMRRSLEKHGWVQDGPDGWNSGTGLKLTAVGHRAMADFIEIREREEAA